jgi:hypothetical protein
MRSFALQSNGRCVNGYIHNVPVVFSFSKVSIALLPCAFGY